jgi:triosephosphate isomerase
MIFINFKTYEAGSGPGAIHLVQVIEALADEYQIKIIPVLQASDIKEVSESSKLEVWSQKVDPIDYGAHTGGILPEAVLEDGASGTFLNHSEARFNDFKDLEAAVKRCGEVGLKTLVFAGNINELSKVLTLNPTFAAYEPPELVGSKEKSVTTEVPEVITHAYELARAAGIPLIVGAGIKSKEDIVKSLRLGAVGVAVASDVVTAKNPAGELKDLITGFQE